MKHALSLLAILLTTQLFAALSHAQTVTLSDADKLLDFAEMFDPNLFAPPAQTQQAAFAGNDWYLRSYPNSGITLAININGTGPFASGDVYAVGGPLGNNPAMLGKLDELNAFVDFVTADVDNDGVLNSEDQCPDTPAAEPVNDQGCGATQLDDDDDSVNNALDQCPATAAGAPVSAEGCSAVQLGIIVTLEDADKLFDYAEEFDPAAFGPPAETQVIEQEGIQLYVRTYASSGISIEVSINGIDPFPAGNVYAVGGPFGEEGLFIDTLANLVAVIDSLGPPNGRQPVYFSDYLEVGDCWNDSFTNSGDFDYSGIPDIVDCDSPHDNEVSAVWEIGDTWPGRAAVDEQAQTICNEAFPSYTGAEYGTSAVDGFSLWPEQDDWEAGGWQGACIVYVDWVAVIGSLQGIGTGALPFDYPADAPIPTGAVLQRAGLSGESDRLLAFDVEGSAEDVVAAVLAAAEAAGWDLDNFGAGSRTTVLEFTTDGDLHTITVTAPEGDEPVEIAYFYPAGER